MAREAPSSSSSAAGYSIGSPHIHRPTGSETQTLQFEIVDLFGLHHLASRLHLACDPHLLPAQPEGTLLLHLVCSHERSTPLPTRLQVHTHLICQALLLMDEPLLTQQLLQQLRIVPQLLI